MAVIDLIRTEHARALSAYSKALAASASFLHEHGQMMGLEYAASAIDYRIGDELMKARYAVERPAIEALIKGAA